MKKQDWFFSQLIRLIYLYLFGIAVFAFARLIFLFSYGNKEDLLHYKDDLLKAFWMGFRVDTQVLMYALILPLLLSLLSPLLSPRILSERKLEKLTTSIFLIILFAFYLLLIGNYYFYQEFKSNYNTLIFAFLEDDTKGILKIFWTQYPVIFLMFLLAVSFIFFWFIIRKIYLKQYHWPIKSFCFKCGFILFFLLFFFLGMRGSLGLFPLGERDLVISENSFINNLASNAVLSFKYAVKHARKEKFDTNISKAMKKYGFDTPEEALSIYLERKIDKADPDLLYSVTSPDSLLEKDPPNVVFILMESMSDYYFDFHSSDFNLLGEFENQMDSLLSSHTFLPKGPRTIQSLEGLIINNPRIQALGQGAFSQHKFSTSHIKPFKDKGYHTSFATGGELGWRNIGNFFKNQYFDEVQGDFYLENKYSDAKGADWGIYDEYLFRSVFEQLKKKKNKPHFFFVMTTTNHPPYYIPDGYPKYPLKLPGEIEEKISGNRKYAYKNFITFQYANDQLGIFIKNILESPLADNTILMITGDHTNTEFFNFEEDEKFIEKAVPLFLYIPYKYRKESKISPYSGHKDLFPTLFHLALSKAKYVYSGKNILEPQKKTFGLTQDGLVSFKEGAIWMKDKPRYYHWKTKNRLFLMQDSIPFSFIQMQKKAQSYRAVMDYLLLLDLQKRKK